MSHEYEKVLTRKKIRGGKRDSEFPQMHRSQMDLSSAWGDSVSTAFWTEKT